MSWLKRNASRRVTGSAVASVLFWLLIAGAAPMMETLPPLPVMTATNAVALAMESNSAASTNLPQAVSSPTASTNSSSPAGAALPQSFKERLEAAKYLANTRQFNLAKPALLQLLAENVPVETQQKALFQLGMVAEAENDLPRAQSIYAQYFNRWPDDENVPEVLLREGHVFREMGLDNMALTKFYGVMTAALSLKNNRLDYYQRLVLEAQMEIAETHYQTGKFADAAEYYTRLLKHDDPMLDRAAVQFRLIRSLVAVGRSVDAAGQAQDFIVRYPDSSDEPEARYYLAQSLKAQGRNAEALQQVLLFLQEQKSKTRNRPEVLTYWQQRVGNEIANQLYGEGDYVKALEVYLNLSRLDGSAAWQLPVDYQIGLTYERLMQPQQAVATYQKIIARESELGTNAAPGLKAVLEMSRWRINFIEWQSKAELANRTLAVSSATNSVGEP